MTTTVLIVALIGVALLAVVAMVMACRANRRASALEDGFVATGHAVIRQDREFRDGLEQIADAFKHI